MPVCVVCSQEKESWFDEFVCIPCARVYGIASASQAERRLFYVYLFRLFSVIVNANLDKGRKRGVHFNIPTVFAPLANLENMQRFLWQQRMFDTVSQLEGDIVECGVGAGASLIVWLTLAWNESRGRKIWGFDTFQGLPPPRSAEDEEARHPDLYKWDSMSVGEDKVEILSALLDRLSFYGLPSHWLGSNLTLMRGLFTEILPLYTGGKIALLFLDVDLYNSYKVALEVLAEKVIPGGVILFDEYANTWEQENYPGARRAIDEFLANHPGMFSPVTRDEKFGKYFVVRGTV